MLTDKLIRGFVDIYVSLRNQATYLKVYSYTYKQALNPSFAEEGQENSAQSILFLFSWDFRESAVVLRRKQCCKQIVRTSLILISIRS